MSDILLMVQKSGVHQLRLVGYPIICMGFIHPKWLFGMSSINSMILPSTNLNCYDHVSRIPVLTPYLLKTNKFN